MEDFVELLGGQEAETDTGLFEGDVLLEGEVRGLGVWVFSSATYSDRQLEFYTKKAYWSYYNGQDAPIYLYKQQEGIIQKTYYTTTLDCSTSPATALETEEVRIKARKMLINGQMYIVLDDRVYDVTGQRVR